MKKITILLYLSILPLLTFAQGDEIRDIFFHVKEKVITVRWEYLCGQGVDYFTLQRQKRYNSPDKPTNVQSVEAACSTGGYNPFAITDSMPLEGTSYYRIQLQYSDGLLLHSNWEGVQFGDLPDYLFNVYPSPALDADKMTFSWEMYNRDLVSFSIIDMQGKTLAEFPTQYLEQGEHSLDWNLSNVQNGLYIIRLNIGQDVVLRKVWR
ncbi:MAG: T9SS type A sorting domain-containing protein [Bacteroidia bacterium]